MAPIEGHGGDVIEPGHNNVIVTAHPDDETLWCGGLPIRFSDRKWTVICCTIPRADPVRAEKFFDACRVLGATPVLRRYLETEPMDFRGLDLSEFDCVVSHNPGGEYGHPQHKEVSRFVLSNYRASQTMLFGYGGQIKTVTDIILDPQEYSQKLAALKCYDHQSPSDSQPKWKALLDRYFPNGGFHRESYC